MPTVNTGIQYINIDEFTTNVHMDVNNNQFPVYGDGIFDTLMETATTHLIAQYKANRIRREEYADAYIKIYEATLQAALTTWLQKPEQAAKVDLLNAQTEHTQAQKLLTDSQKTHEDAKKLLTDAQKALVTAQATHESSKKANTEAQTALLTAQTTHENAKKLLTDAQKALVTAQTTHEPAKKLNTDADTDLKKAQKAYITNQSNAAAKDKDLKTAQINSENMKTSLYKRQIEGYDENYKEKVLKIILDAFTVAFSVASDAWKGGLPKVMTVSGIDKICEPILKDINTAATNSNVETIRNMTSFTMPTSITNTSNFSKK